MPNQLSLHSIDLTDLARAGKLDPIIGRDEEIRRTIGILLRRTKSNPVLIGHPGVGKTAIINGIARRIIAGEVPERMKGKRVLSVDLSAVVAGTKYRGEFEAKFEELVKNIEAAQREGNRAIIFVDEVHVLFGLGKGGGTDAGQMIKPALARGLQIVGATTPDEYRKTIAKDPALDRRFQSVTVDEPSVQTTISILRCLRSRYEAHYGLEISDSALVAAVVYANRYIPSRFLPDKAIDLVDEAASSLRLVQESRPEELETMESDLMMLKLELESLRREVDGPSRDKCGEVERQLEEKTKRKGDLEGIWLAERARLEKIKQTKLDLKAVECKVVEAQSVLGKAECELDKVKLELEEAERKLAERKGEHEKAKQMLEDAKSQIEKANSALEKVKRELQAKCNHNIDPNEAERELEVAKSTLEEAKHKVSEAEGQLKVVQQPDGDSQPRSSPACTRSEAEKEQAKATGSNEKEERGILQARITPDDIARVVAKATGIPVQNLTAEEKDRLKNMEQNLSRAIINQSRALASITSAIRMSRVGLSNPKRPIASFLFLGPTGVGKTEVCKQLSSYLTGSPDPSRGLININMSEYHDRHTVSRLIGAAPGYVGFEEGGQLTEAVRRKPYAVVLLDEIEKAHKDVVMILLQILDEGQITDSQGRKVDFKVCLSCHNSSNFSFQNTIICITSNLGSVVFSCPSSTSSDSGIVTPQAEGQILSSVRSILPPELLNRLDAMIVFNKLPQSAIAKIVDLQVAEVRARLREKRVELSVSENAREWLAREAMGLNPRPQEPSHEFGCLNQANGTGGGSGGGSDAYGAREVGRIVRSFIVEPLAECFLQETIRDGEVARVEVEEVAVGRPKFTRPNGGTTESMDGEGEAGRESEAEKGWLTDRVVIRRNHPLESEACPA